MKKPLIIFGAGKISQAISYYFERDTNYDIVGYVVDDVFVNNTTFLGKPLISLLDVNKTFPSKKYTVFVAVGYQGVNSLRITKYNYFKELGYSFASYVSPNVIGNFNYGENSIIMDQVAVQPYAQFGNNVFVWGGAMIGHHAIIEDHCWLTGGCLIGGATSVGAGTFVGLGATISNEINIGKHCMIGASVLITKSLSDKTVLLSPSTEPHRLNTDQFTKMSSCFRVKTV